MPLSYAEYWDRMKGCWMGKTVGGTLGAPLEGFRGVFDVDFYLQDLSKGPVPNDDLDLQLVWLNAVERFGAAVDARLLAEYWLLFVTPNWCEYGAGKNNLRRGFPPALSGYLNNVNRDSCGCFIRSELWACLAPGFPELAARYALEDAIVDHSNEGAYAEVFCAAMQAAAFVESDVQRLADIGRSYVPPESAIYRVAEAVKAYYNAGRPWQECRKMILTDFPGSFGEIGGYGRGTESPEDYPASQAGYDAPSNVGIALLGLFYGEGDFEKSICMAANCGEDADCTTATLAATLGIMLGYSRLPEKWTAPVGETIATLCIADVEGDDLTVPRTVGELADRVARQVPRFLGPRRCDCMSEGEPYAIHCLYGDALYNRERRAGMSPKVTVDFLEELAVQPFGVKYDEPLYRLVVDYTEPPYITGGTTKTVKLHFRNKFNQQHWVTIRWILPEGFRVLPAASTTHSLEQWHTNDARLTVTFEILVPENLESEKYELLADICLVGRATRQIVPLSFICTQIPACDKGDMHG